MGKLMLIFSCVTLSLVTAGAFDAYRIGLSKPKFLHAFSLEEADPDIQALVKNAHSNRKKRAIGDVDAGNALTEEEQMILDWHNHYRELTGSPKVKPLKWDSALAAMAQRVVDTCVWQHVIYDVNPHWDGSIGQNLYGSLSQEANGKHGVAAWYRELEFYDFASHSCEDGKDCWHYTQVVAAKTEYVGCAVKICPLIQVGVFEYPNAKFIACNYFKGVNNAKKPY